MGLPRLTLASTTLKDFISLTRAEQEVIGYLLTRRSMNVRPLHPTCYLTFKEIADATGLKTSTVAKTISILKRKQWILETGYLPHHSGEGRQYKWVIAKVNEDMAETYRTEVMTEAPTDDTIYRHDGKEWRVGGALGYQFRNIGSERWADKSIPPEPVSTFFEGA